MKFHIFKNYPYSYPSLITSIIINLIYAWIYLLLKSTNKNYIVKSR